MFCHLTRWMISRAADSGKKTSRFADRHAARCRACGDYARFTQSLPAQFAGETPAFLAEVPDFPLDSTRTPAESSGNAREARSGRRSFLRPLPIAAALGVIVSGLVLYRVVLYETPLTITDHKAAIAGLKSVTAFPDEFQGAVAQAESPLVRERFILEKSVRSAIEYFQARLNIRIAKKQGANSLEKRPLL
jgi:hypothetical protein